MNLRHPPTKPHKFNCGPYGPKLMKWKTSDNIIGTNFIVNAPIFLAVLTNNVEIGFLSRSKVCLPKFATDIIVYISRPMNGTLDLKSSAESPGIWL